MLTVSVKVDTSSVNRWFDLLKDDATKAIASTLNKLATTARAQGAREIVKAGYGIKVGDIKRAMSIRRATPAELRSLVTATGKPIPLLQYSARQTKTGVTIAVLNGRKTIKSAFIATMRSGHKGVFIRTGAAAEHEAGAGGHFKISKGPAMKGTTHRRGRLPIRELFGPAIPSAFVNKNVQDALQRLIRERFNVVLEQQVTAWKYKRH